MHKALKHSLIYVVSILVIVLLLAGYFFMRMEQSLSAAEPDTGRLEQQKNALVMQSQQLKDRIAQLEHDVAELDNKIAQRRAALDDLEVTRASDAQCASEKDTDNAVARLETQLAQSQEEAQTCTARLNTLSEETDNLAHDAAALRGAETELTRARTTIASLRNELAKARDDHQQRMDELQGKLADSNTTPATDEAVRQLDTALAGARQEIATLESRLAQLQKENDAFEETARSSGKLEITAFTATPRFCRAPSDSSSQEVCLTSIEISASFNFSPNGFIAMIIYDPQGHIIGRESIAGRTINRVTFDMDGQSPVQPGEYNIEFRVNDVFNRFRETRRFMVTPI